MDELFFAVIALLVVMFLAYRRLRSHIDQLEEQIRSQQESHTKLLKSNNDLIAELKRIERRIDSAEKKKPAPPAPEIVPEPEQVPTLQAVYDEHEPQPLPMRQMVPDEPRIPPPLPEFRAAAFQDSGPYDDTEATYNEPSAFSQIPWREILKRMHMLPPSKSSADGTAESQLAAWWVIRIGLILLIIAAVFFGIHVSQHTPPWLRVLTLGFVSLGTIALGARMNERLEGFGRAIIGGGFALLYFTAFASFALPATKIIDSPALGAMAQLAALIMAIVWSLWRKDQTVATLTLFLGFVSCAFSHAHDLDRFSTLGILMLAAAGSFFLASRGWLTPYVTALAGSWSGFAIFTVLDDFAGSPPPFLPLMCALVVLTILLEAGGFVWTLRAFHAGRDRLRRVLILSNTTAAAAIGYGVMKLIHPAELSDFYFVSSAVFFAFTALHHLRTTDRAVTVSFFLKSSAMLCLGFAAAFSGPTRWLAIAFQAFALLWTARRSGSRWIAVGFVMVWIASAGWFGRDLMHVPPATWRWLDSFRILGAFYLVSLTVQLALHARWFPQGIGGSNQAHETQANGFRLFGSLAIGLMTLWLALTPRYAGHSDPGWFLLAMAVIIGMVCPLLRNGIPCMAACIPLLSSYITYAVLPESASEDALALCLGPTLILTAFGASEMVRRHWPEKLAGGNWVREGALLGGIFTLLPFTHALGAKYGMEGHSGIALFVLFPTIAGVAILSRQRRSACVKATEGSAWFHSFIGLLILAGGAETCHHSGFYPAALAIAGLIPMGLAARFRSWNITLGGVFPILGGFVSLWMDLRDGTPGRDVFQDSINLAVLLVISVSLAIVSWKKITDAALRTPALSGEAVLHGLGVFSLQLFFDKHLEDGPAFFASAVLGLLMFAIGRRWSFRALAAVSWLPVALACLVGILGQIFEGVATGEIWFLLGALLVLIQLLAVKSVPRDETRELSLRAGDVYTAIAVMTWTLAILAATEDPWQPAALAGVALLSCGLWRWRSIERIGHMGLAPMTVAFCMAVVLMLEERAFSGTAALKLASILLTSAGIAVNGMIMADATRRIMGQRITASSALPWFHGVGALMLVFYACSIDRMVDNKLTAVYWGVSAILMFICGLFAGLRAYRLAGLLGLVFCIGHIFIFDIQDTFYRIIAFFVIGLLMLAIGFLYNRFRDRISAMDS